MIISPEEALSTLRGWMDRSRPLLLGLYDQGKRGLGILCRVESMNGNALHIQDFETREQIMSINISKVTTELFAFYSDRPDIERPDEPESQFGNVLRFTLSPGLAMSLIEMPEKYQIGD